MLHLRIQHYFIAIQRNTLWCDIHCVFSAPRIEQRCRMTTENSQSHRCRFAHTLIHLYMCMRRSYSAFYRCGTNVGYSMLALYLALYKCIWRHKCWLERGWRLVVSDTTENVFEFASAYECVGLSNFVEHGAQCNKTAAAASVRLIAKHKEPTFW